MGPASAVTSRSGESGHDSVVKAIRRTAKKAGIEAKGVASHIGRRTVITALYANGGLDLADIARHVGHSDSTTTAGYVRRLGNRPSDTARRAAELLDLAADESPAADGDGPGPHG